MKNQEINIAAEAIDQIKQYIFQQLKDPSIPLIPELQRIIVEYYPFYSLTPEDHSILTAELTSHFPDSKKLNAVLSQINVFNLENLNLAISPAGLKILIKSLRENLSISAFIIQNTQLLQNGANLIYYFLNEILLRSPRFLTSFTVSESESNHISCYDEQSLLSLFKKDCINSLTLINTGIRLRKVLQAISTNRNLGSLTLEKPSIKLKPMGKNKQIPQTENLKKIFEKLDQCSSLSFIDISNIIPYSGFKLYQKTMQNFNKTWQNRKADILQITVNRVEKAFAEIEHLVRYPTVLLDMILGYIFGDFTTERQNITYMNNENLLIFNEELKSSNARVAVLKKLLSGVNGLRFRDTEITISEEGRVSFIKALQESPHVTSFDLSNANIICHYIDFGLPKTRWMNIFLLWQALVRGPRPLHMLDISCIDWNSGAHNSIKDFDLNYLLPDLKHPIEFLKLSHYNYLSQGAATCIYNAGVTMFETRLLKFLTQDLVTHLDLTSMLVRVNQVLAAIKNCKRLRSIKLDGNFLHLGATNSRNTQDTVDTIIEQFSQIPNLTFIQFQNPTVFDLDFTYGAKSDNTLQNKLKTFNGELAKRQNEIKAIAQKNRYRLMEQNPILKSSESFTVGNKLDSAKY